ncbi:hypothetical protein EGW08_002953, partial [Elysia chlorotica]
KMLVMSRCWRFLLLLACTLTPAPVLVMGQLSIPRLREMSQEGNTSLEYIMGVVMMNLPQELVSRIQAKLTLSSAANRGFGVSKTWIYRSSSGTTNINIDSTGDNSGTGIINNVDNSEPIRLNLRRKKRSFGLFDSDLFGSSGYGSFHHPGASSGGFGFGYGYGYPKGYDGTSHTHPESPGHAHPGDQNGNLFGGAATSYVTYPGERENLQGQSTHGHKSYNSFHGSRFGQGGFNKENCPRQADQGFVYQYDGDALTYPAIEIGNELFTRSLPGSDLLFQALNRQIVFPTDPPKIFIDEFLLSSNVTCPFKEDQVWSYRSQTLCPATKGDQLKVLVPFFKKCLNRFCKNCGGVKSDFFWGSSASNSANVCVTEYQTVTLWSYCEELTPNRRIVSDRILVPNACTCTTVPCPSHHGYHK